MGRQAFRIAAAVSIIIALLRILLQIVRFIDGTIGRILRLRPRWVEEALAFSTAGIWLTGGIVSVNAVIQLACSLPGNIIGVRFQCC